MREKMICPACGAEMNLHAEKVVYSERAPGESSAMDGHLEEMHACPRCGRVESGSHES